MSNQRLVNAKSNKADEYYTRLCDIEDEMKHYKKHFKNKTVYCNCDDPYESNFFKYFALNFDALGLKRLICTCHGESTMAGRQMPLEAYMGEDYNTKEGRKAHYIDIRRDDPKGLCNLEEYEQLLKKKGVVKRLKGDGDFRSNECIALLEQADIVVTNPPFSLFREYMGQLVKYDKKYIILGNPNALTYKEIFPLLKDNRMWVGTKTMSTEMLFHVTDEFAQELVATKKENEGYKIKDGEILGRAMAIWFTNLDIKKRHEPIFLYAKYDAEKNKKFDGFDIINVDRVDEIPCDYDGVMGVPISFMDKYDPDQFEIVGTIGASGQYNVGKATINGIAKFKRILIKRKQI